MSGRKRVAPAQLVHAAVMEIGISTRSDLRERGSRRPRANANATSVRLEQYRRHAQCRSRLAEAAVQSAQRHTMVGADGKMQRVAGAQAERVLVGEPGCCAKLQPRNRQDGKT